MVNGETVPASRYYELKVNDGEPLLQPLAPFFFCWVNLWRTDTLVIMFGQSQREYVLINEDAI
jgi:hypothetical protein